MPERTPEAAGQSAHADTRGPAAPPEPAFITTPIYYVNDRPHIGHCYTTLLADVAARTQRLIGRDVFFLTGTDEHADKVSKAAAERGLSPQAWSDQNAERFREAFALMGISNDDFIRTSEPRHKARASAYIARLIELGEIELGEYSGWYDPSQEEYLTESVAKEHEFLSPVTGRPLERRVEQNYFFALDRHAAWLEGEVERGAIRVEPEARRNEVLGRIRQGLQRVPVSRKIRPEDDEAARDWGIRMPGDPEHRVYVWIDALFNYLSAIDNEREPATAQAEGGPRRRYWAAGGGGDGAAAGVAPVLHLMAKDILWFHAVIWPCMLRALGEPPPAVVYAHAYWIAEGRKMSKSLGNFIEIDRLRDYGERYGIDAVRWFLVTQGPLGPTDADFSHRRFVEVYNADLANGLGNAVSRVSNMIVKYFGGELPDHGGTLSFSAEDTGGEAFDWPALAAAAFAGLDAAGRGSFAEIDGPARRGAALVAAVDRFIALTRPFSLAKRLDDDAGGAKRARLAAILYCSAEALRVATLAMHPAMPEKTAGVWRRWGCDARRDPADARAGFVAPLAELARFAGPHGLVPGTPIEKGEALFMRADPDDPPPGGGVG